MLDVNKNEKILLDENNFVLLCEKDIGKDRCCDKKLDDSGDIIFVMVVKDLEVEKVCRSILVNFKEQNGLVVKNMLFLLNMFVLSNMDLSKFCVVVDGSRCRYLILLYLDVQKYDYLWFSDQMYIVYWGVYVSFKLKYCILEKFIRFNEIM